MPISSSKRGSLPNKEIDMTMKFFQTIAPLHPMPFAAKKSTRQPATQGVAIAAALACTLMVASIPARASASPQPVGKKLSQAQIEQLAPLGKVDIDGRSYQIIGTVKSADGRSASQLLGPDGVVAQSFNEILISEQPTAEVRQQLAAIIGKAQSVRYYDDGNVSILRFADIQQAAAALPQIRAALPKAAVGLPIIVNIRRPQ